MAGAAVGSPALRCVTFTGNNWVEVAGLCQDGLTFSRGGFSKATGYAPIQDFHGSAAASAKKVKHGNGKARPHAGKIKSKSKGKDKTKSTGKRRSEQSDSPKHRNHMMAKRVLWRGVTRAPPRSVGLAAVWRNNAMDLACMYRKQRSRSSRS